MPIVKNFKLTPNHTYYFDGPSVSEIVSYIYGNQYETVPQWVLQNAGQRGTCIHAQLEMNNWYCRCPVYQDEHVRLALQMFKLKENLREQYKPTREFREATVLHDHLIGQIDLLWLYDDGKKAIFIDYKTTATQHLESWKCQLGLYFYLTFPQEWKQKLSKTKWMVIHKNELVELKLTEKDMTFYLGKLAEFEMLYMEE